MILPRYLYRQASTTALLTLLVLLGVVSALFLAELLSQAAQGQIPGQALVMLLMLKLPEAVLMVAPLALLMGTLFALGQANEASEVTIARASGASYWVCFRPLVGLALAWAVGLVVVAGWVSPWAVAKTDAVLASGAERALLASVQAGQFDRLNHGQLTVYVASVDGGSGVLSDVFVQSEDGDGAEVISAPTGRLWQDQSDQSRYLSLSQGTQLRQMADGAWMRLTFDRNDVRLPAPSQDSTSTTEMALSLVELQPRENALMWREWHWRLAPPMAAFLLGVLAIPLAWRPPRSGRFVTLVVAMVAYLVYSNAVHVGLVWMEKVEGTDGLGLWPIHGALAALVAMFWVWRWRLW